MTVILKVTKIVQSSLMSFIPFLLKSAFHKIKVQLYTKNQDINIDTSQLTKLQIVQISPVSPPVSFFCSRVIRDPTLRLVVNSPESAICEFFSLYLSFGTFPEVGDLDVSEKVLVSYFVDCPSMWVHIMFSHD